MVLPALYISKAAWNAAVTDKAIKNCYRHAGFTREKERLQSSNGILDNKGKMTKILTKKK